MSPYLSLQGIFFRGQRGGSGEAVDAIGGTEHTHKDHSEYQAILYELLFLLLWNWKVIWQLNLLQSGQESQVFIKTRPFDTSIFAQNRQNYSFSRISRGHQKILNYGRSVLGTAICYPHDGERFRHEGAPSGQGKEYELRGQHFCAEGHPAYWQKNCKFWQETTLIVSMVFSRSKVLEKEVFLFQRLDAEKRGQMLHLKVSTASLSNKILCLVFRTERCL